jgi:hypothetical protein
MAAIARAALLLLCLSLPAGAQFKSLALYSGQTNGLDASTIQTTRQELKRLLSPTGVDLLWKDLAHRKTGEEFDYVVVASFDGVCSAEEVPAASLAMFEGTVSLADSSVSNGRVLPFFRIDCKHLLATMAPALRRMNAQERRTAMGIAIARVMAHEIYHIVAQTTGHQDHGIAKPSFSVLDLTAGRFDFDVWSLAQMRPMPSRDYADSGTR